MRRPLIAVLTAVLLLGACGGDNKKDVSASSNKTTTSVDGETTTSAADVAAGASTTAAGAPKAGTTKKATGTTTKAGAPAAGGQQSTPAGIKATAPGSYTYKVTGTMQIGVQSQPVDTTSSLKVDPLQGTDQHSSQTSQQGGSESVLRYQADGAYLVNLKLTGAISKEFKFEPPALAFPQPATVGKAWTWSAKSTDGKTTVKSDFKIVRNETIAIGGEQVPTVVVEATVVTDGDVKSTSKRTMWTSEAYRLIVRQDEKIDGTYSGFAFKGDTSSVLQSTKPA